jgi:uncharacterized protein YndB with AHSA1/START domain
MIKFHTEQTIARSALDVWTYAADITRHPEWMGVTDARVLQGQGTQAGARGRERSRFGPFQWDVEFEVAEAQPGRRLVWRSVRGGPFQIEVALDLERVGPASTRATYRAAIQMRGLWRLLTPLVAMDGRAGLARELQRLKEQVEGSPAMAPATS